MALSFGRKRRAKPRPVRCLAILGLCLFVTAGLEAQTPDPTPLDAPQPGVRPPLSPFPRFEDSSFLRDPSNPSDARYIGSQPNLEIRWAISEHFLAALNLAGFLTGTFLQQSPPSKEIAFVNVGLTYRF